MTDASSDTSATPAAPLSAKAWLRAQAGWVIVGTLFAAIVMALLVAIISPSVQVDLPQTFDPSVPRKVVPVPGHPQSQLYTGAHYAMTPAPQQTVVPLQLPLQTIEPSARGPLPIAAAAKPVPPAKTETTQKPLADHHLAQFAKPVIAIVIDDVGLDRRHSAQVVDLPATMTLAFMPYAQQLAQQTQRARDQGHELIVHMPMEPDDLAHNNPGPNALLLKNGEAENMRRFDHNLASFTGYMGINNHMGSALTADRAAITPVLQDLKARGLWFLDSKTNARSVAASIADDIGLPYASRDVFLDNVDDKNAVLAQLRQTETIARRKGYAIAIGHPHAGTIAALQDWVRTVEARGFTLVPLSTIIAARFPHAAMPRYARAHEAKSGGATIAQNQ